MKLKKSLLMGFILSAICIVNNAMATPQVTVTNVTSGGDIFEATVTPDGNWMPVSVTFWAWCQTDYLGWKVLSDTSRDSQFAEYLGDNRYRMAADNLGFLGDSKWGYQHEINSLETINRNQGFWIGIDDPETPGDFPFYMVLRNGMILDENEAWNLGTQISPTSETYPDWAFSAAAVPEPASLLLLGVGLLGIKLKRKSN